MTSAINGDKSHMRHSNAPDISTFITEAHSTFGKTLKAQNLQQFFDGKRSQIEPTFASARTTRNRVYNSAMDPQISHLNKVPRTAFIS
jgi:hypothetical protein